MPASPLPNTAVEDVWGNILNEAIRTRTTPEYIEENLPERLTPTALSATIGADLATDNTPGSNSVEARIRRETGVARRQAALLGEFHRRQSVGIGFTICVLGDSTVYGHDETSPERLAATGTAGNGAPHTAPRSPSPWPSVMATRLGTAFEGTTPVINRGFSGDTVNSAYTHWPESSGAHLTIISLGINDAATNLSLTAYIDGMDRLIRREHSWGAAVVLATALKDRSGNGYQVYDSYRNALIPLAQSYGIPVIDLDEMMAGYGAEYYSDNTHLNTAGNSVVGTRFAAAFIGAGPHKPKHVSDGARLGVRGTIDNVRKLGGAVWAQGNYLVSTPAEGDSPVWGVSIQLPTNGRAIYSVYVEEADTIVFPYYLTAGATSVELSVDYGINQADNILDEIVGTSPSTSSTRAPAVRTYTHAAQYLPASFSAGSQGVRIPTPGWHTIHIKNTGATAVYLLALEFLSYRMAKLISP